MTELRLTATFPTRDEAAVFASTHIPAIVKTTADGGFGVYEFLEEEESATTEVERRKES